MGRLLTVLLIFVFSELISQNTLEEVYNQTAKVYGIDDVLVNGSKYRSLHPVASGNPFFTDGTFSEGDISLKGRDFKVVFLKFDIEQQKVILKVFPDSANFKVIVLNNNYINNFTLQGKYFVNISSLLKTNSVSGFYELVYHGSFVFGRSYKKEFVANYSNNYPNGKYSKIKKASFVFREDGKHRIKKNKDLYYLFPQKKDLIKRFIKDNKIKLRKASNHKLNILMQYCDEISTE